MRFLSGAPACPPALCEFPYLACNVAARLLALLSLLQSRPQWTSAELADRLRTTDRTVRRDIARLRDLGYPVDAELGRTGGYRLGVGGALRISLSCWLVGLLLCPAR